jgi:ssDNA-binding Zn-finger/Zn-ribbon topoisomerase 1
MEAKQSSSDTKKKSRDKDPCPVCDFDLYYNLDVTKRIGIINVKREVLGWVCPECDSEFDLDDNIVYIYGENSAQGKA